DHTFALPLRPNTASSTSTTPQADPSPRKLRKVGELDSSPRTSQLTGSTTLDVIPGAQQQKDDSQPSSPTTARRILEGEPKTSPKMLQKEKPKVIALQEKVEEKPQEKPVNKPEEELKKAPEN